MKNPLTKILGLLTVSLLLSNCASFHSYETRIKKNPSIYQNLSAKDKELTAAGKIRQGMSKEAVFMSWGKPSERREASSSGTLKETWIYKRHQEVVDYNYGVGFGYGYGRGYGRRGYSNCGYYPSFYGGPSIAYVPYTVAKVVFVNGKVVSWETRK